jgi:radical SAM superfamily enzyme YgiQ (UPF0313 family)
MKVLLISANTLTTPYPVYPLGLDYVAAALAPSHSVRIADMNSSDMEALGEMIADFRPEAIGISLRNIDNTDTTDPQGFLAGYQRLIQFVRGRTQAAVILGGAGFSIFPEKLMALLGADFGIAGEGERLAALLDALGKDAPVRDMPGVIASKSTGSPPVPFNHPLKRHFDPAYLHLPFYLHHGGMLNIQTKRGCPFRCIYCTYPNIEGRRLRLTPPESAAQTAKALQEAGAKYFFITDSVFNADIAHSLAVAEQFQRQGVSIPWGAFLAPLQMPANYLELLVRAGLTHAEFGTESLSDRVLNAYGKPFRRNEILQAHEMALKAGLHVAHYFLLGGPGETPKTLETTLSHIDKLKKSVLFLFCGMRIYPHTHLFDRAVDEGRIPSDEDLVEPVFYESAAIGRDEIIQCVRTKAAGRFNWVIGSGGDQTSALLQRMYKRGYSGPLWELLIRGS